MTSRDRLDAMTAAEKQDLRRRFAMFIADHNDNRRARITVQEAELLISLAGEDDQDPGPWDDDQEQRYPAWMERDPVTGEIPWEESETYRGGNQHI